ncbi:MAG: outer membrane lipoprotein carrier protein LolA [Mariprofundales bacterium]
MNKKNISSLLLRASVLMGAQNKQPVYQMVKCCWKSPSMCFCIVVLSTLFYTQPSYAVENIDVIFSQLVVREPIKLAYEETHYMQLLDEPVKSSGYVYISATHFVLEQKKPHRRIMATNHLNMWIYDNINKVKRSRKISRFSNNNTALGALALIMRKGDSAKLKDHYKITLSEDKQVWALILEPIKDELRKQYSSITLQGQKGQRAELITIDYANGNHTAWKMHDNNAISDITKEIKSLIKEAGGR